MIVRPFTFLTALLFALSGAYLFVVKHQSQSLEVQMEQTAATTRQDEEAIRVLKAQWALEADPSRIASLAAKFTGLQPMRPVQLVTMASLATELPAPGGVAPYNNPEDEVPGLPGSNAVPSPMGVPIEVKGRVAALQSSSSDLVKAVSVQQVAANFPPPPPVRPRRYVRHQDQKMVPAPHKEHGIAQSCDFREIAGYKNSPLAIQLNLFGVGINLCLQPYLLGAHLLHGVNFGLKPLVIRQRPNPNTTFDERRAKNQSHIPMVAPGSTKGRWDRNTPLHVTFIFMAAKELFHRPSG